MNQETQDYINRLGEAFVDRKPAAQAPCFSYGISDNIAAFH